MIPSPENPPNTGSRPRAESLQRAGRKYPRAAPRAPFYSHKVPQSGQAAALRKGNFTSKSGDLTEFARGKSRAARELGFGNCCSPSRGQSQQQLLFWDIFYFQLLDEEREGKSRQQELPAPPSPCKPGIRKSLPTLNTSVGSPTNQTRALRRQKQSEKPSLDQSLPLRTSVNAPSPTPAVGIATPWGCATSESHKTRGNPRKAKNPSQNQAAKPRLDPKALRARDG